MPKANRSARFIEDSCTLNRVTHSIYGDMTSKLRRKRRHEFHQDETVHTLFSKIIKLD